MGGRCFLRRQPDIIDSKANRFSFFQNFKWRLTRHGSSHVRRSYFVPRTRNARNARHAQSLGRTGFSYAYSYKFLPVTYSERSRADDYPWSVTVLELVPRTSI
eukprot:scaffold627317_cov18-Prasinocladus_malaysianus.AAC.1